jgi:hypothetical protein
VLPAESDRVHAMYIEGLLRQIWLRTDLPGACFILEAPDLDTAHSAVLTLPMAGFGPT